MELISMTCRNCGGKLKISTDADQFICQHCGTEYLVSFTEGAVSIRLVSEDLKKIQASSDKTASELALVRIKKEKEEFDVNSDVFDVVGLDFILKSKIIIDNEEDPNVGLELLKLALKSEKSKIIKNPKKIREIEEWIEEMVEYTRKWNDLLMQEAFHRKIIERK